MKKKRSTGTDGTTVRSVERAVDLLEVLMSSPRPINLAELSGKVGLHPSTAHRLLATLEKRSFIYQDPVSKVYSPGLKLMYPAPGMQQHHILQNLVTPYLQEISRKTGEGASMAIVSGNHAMVVAKAASGRSVDISMLSGVLVPLHCTGVGKIILAYLDPGEVKRIINQEGLPASTLNTITDFDRLQEELQKIQKQGYAVDNEEWETGIRCVAAPVFSSGKNIFGAISVAAPSGRILPAKYPQFAEVINTNAAKLSAILGFSVENDAEIRWDD